MSGSTLSLSPQRHTRDFRRFLQTEFEARRDREPSLSLRRFAREIGEDASSLSKLLHGQTPIGPRTIKKLGAVLMLGPDEIQEFISIESARRRQARNKSAGGVRLAKTDEVAPEFVEIQADIFRAIADWYHYAILELIQLKGFDPKPTRIAKTLEIPVVDIRAALERLEHIGMIEVGTDGSIKDLTGGWSTNIAQPFFAPAHRKLQKQLLERAIRALESTPLARRDQTSITLAFDSSRMSEAKQWLKDFRRRFNEEFGVGESRDSVYQLCLSLYPLTAVKKERVS